MRIIGFSLLLLIAACDDDKAPPPPLPSPSTAPTFTSAATASVRENQVLAYQATATDPQNDLIAFAIDGGADAARFTITPEGALSFIWGPGFESPLDADKNNVYQVRLRVSDGVASSTLEVSITVTDVGLEGIVFRRMTQGYDQPSFIAVVPLSPETAYGIERTGGVWYQSAVGGRVGSLDVGHLSTANGGGLLAYASSPNVRHLVFVTAPGGNIEIRQYTGGQYQVHLTIPAPRGGNFGGWMAFGPDGFLYIATGDGGGVGDPDDNAQNPNSLLGKLLRIKINPDPSAADLFQPAPGNPYINGGGNPLIYASGFRNPNGGFFDGNKLFIGDRGQGREEINIVEPNQPGQNFGWPYFDGTQPYTGSGPSGLIVPVTEYSHGLGPNQGSAVVGGFVMEEKGLYFFADNVSGHIWSVPRSQLARGKVFPSSDYDRRNIEVGAERPVGKVAAFGRDAGGSNQTFYMLDVMATFIPAVVRSRRRCPLGHLALFRNSWATCLTHHLRRIRSSGSWRTCRIDR